MHTGWSVLGQHYLVLGIKCCLHSPWQVEHTKGKPRKTPRNPVLVEGLWLRPDCSMWQGLRAGKAKASCAVYSPRFACTCIWAEVSANVSSREVISGTSLRLESSRTKPHMCKGVLHICTGTFSWAQVFGARNVLLNNPLNTQFSTFSYKNLIENSETLV